MVQEAEANAGSDKKRRSEVETRRAEALVMGRKNLSMTSAIKRMQTPKPKLKPVSKPCVRPFRHDIEVISEKSAALSQSMMKMGEAAYNAEDDQADESDGRKR